MRKDKLLIWLSYRPALAHVHRVYSHTHTHTHTHTHLHTHTLTHTLSLQLLCDHVHITLNKNTIHGDRNALNPGAVRIGTPALTTRGFKEADFEAVAGLLNKAVALVKKIQVTLLLSLRCSLGHWNYCSFLCWFRACIVGGVFHSLQS